MALARQQIGQLACGISVTTLHPGTQLSRLATFGKQARQPTCGMTVTGIRTSTQLRNPILVSQQSR